MDVMALGSKSTLGVRNEENLCLGNVPLISIHSKFYEQTSSE